MPWGPLPSGDDCARAIRFGLVTDRFEAGHKLKTLAHIAQNQIVLSFSDVARDFSDIADHDLFLRRLSSVADIAAHADHMATYDPAELRQRFLAFQRTCAETFTWKAVADALLQAVERIKR